MKHLDFCCGAGRGVRVLAVCAAFALAALGARATTYTWTGSAAGDWEEESNWDQASGYPSAAEDVAVVTNPASGSVTVTVNTPFKIATLKVGDVDATGNAGTATVCFKTGLATNEVSGDVTVASGGVLTHYGPNDTETQRLALKVGGAMTVASGGSVDVRVKGYKNHKGPGNKRNNPVHGSTTDEWFNWSQVGDGRCYGSVREPLEYGSGAHDYNTASESGGGSIYLDVAGDLTVDGTVTASANHGGSAFLGAAGSVFVKCATLLGSGSVVACSGNGTYSSYASASGGRVAVWQSVATASSFSGTISTGHSAATKAACGTVYLEYAGDKSGEGTLIVDNAGATLKWSTDLEAASKMPDASRPFGTVIVRNGGYLRLVNGATLKVTKGITVDSKSRLVASTDHVIELVGDEECTILGGAYMTIESLVCTNAGKTVKFGTSSADKITIANGKTVRFRGAEGKPVTLASTTAGTRFQIFIGLNAAESTFEHVTIGDCDASSGDSILAISSTDADNNRYVAFSDPIVPGAAIVWTGASDTVWHNPENWDPVRKPVETDAISIPAVATAKYPALGSVTYSFNRIAVGSGATLSLNATTLTVTNKLSVAGSLIFAGSESLTLTGDADFTGGTVTPASSRLYVAGTGDQALDFGDTVLNSVTVSKTSGNISFGAHGFTATTFVCSAAQAMTLAFAAGETYTIPNLSLAGTSERHLALASTVPGTKWKLVTTSDGQGVSGVNATDSDASDGATVMAGRQSAQSNCTNWDTTSEVAAWSGGSGNFTDAAKWSTGTVPGTDTIVQIVAGESETASVTLPAGNDLTVAALTLKGATGGSAALVCNAALTVVGNVEVQQNATLTLNSYCDNGAAPNAVGGDLHVWSGGTVTHTGPASAENAKVHLEVRGNATVDDGGKIDVTGRGFSTGCGPGGTAKNYFSPSHAGWGYLGTDYASRVPYGSVLCPTNWGSGSCATAGGGVIRLTVGGTLAVDGSVSADGAGQQNYAGTGGSVWIRCGTLTGGGTITARCGTSSAPGNGQYTGSGGRVAVYQTNATDFAAFPHTRILAGRNVYSAPGTVYLEAAGSSTGADLYVEGTGNSTTYKTAFPMPADGSDYSVYSNVNVHVGLASVLSFGGRTDATGVYGIRSLEVASGGKAEVVAGATIRSRCGVSVGANSTLAFKGSNVVDLCGSEDAQLVGFSRASGLAGLVCTNAGKTVYFETNAVGRVTIPEGGTLALNGGEEDPVSLLPLGGYGIWQISVDGTAEATLRALAVSNSDASAGVALTAISSQNLGGNTSWSFSDPIVSGDPIVWTGAVSTDWSLGANWDRNRTPVETDYITIPQLAGAAPNYPTVGEGNLSYDRLTVAAGAALTVAGTTLTVGDQLNVRGTLAFTGSVHVYLGHDADFTGATVTSENTLFHIAGTDDQTLDFGDVALDRVVVEKTSGDVSFVTHGFTAKSFRCFAAQGMTLAFAAGQTYAFGSFYANGADLENAPLRLVSSATDSAWRLSVTNGHNAVGGVYVKDCSAVAGALHAGIRSTDAGGNVNVDFAHDVSCWVTGASGDFNTAANWSSGTVPGPATDVLLTAGDGETTVVTLAADVVTSVGSLVVGGAGDGTVDFVANGPLVVCGSAEVRAGGTWTPNRHADVGAAPNVVSNDLRVLAGGTITHTGPASQENDKVHLRVGGGLSVDEGGKVTATGKGYTIGSGPGSSGTYLVGGAYAGFGHSNSKSPYGSVLKPVNWGATGGRGPASGGAIRLDVGGVLTLNGTVEADGAPVTSDVYASGGGSVWIECAALVGDGTITVRESNREYTSWEHQTTASGGRIAVYQRTAKSFAAFPKSRMLTQHSVGTPCGTVYLKSAGGTDLYIDGGAKAGMETLLPMPTDGDAEKAYADANLHIGYGARVAVCAYDAATEAKSATRLVVRDLDLSDATAYLKLYGSTVEVRQYMHKKGKGWYKDYEASQASGNLVLGTGGSVIWRATGGLQFLVR